ncbi:type IV pilus modification PilV family protein [Sanguibacter sp. A247]|uniref:type IV pilus modification PilV family protein n=1 Tax=unclassified Sanguibacter TaxID=2645534 RepID=UPI003FD715E1
MQPHDSKNFDEGFSLVEILVAMMLFMVLLLGLIPVFVQSLSLTNRSASVTTASRIANSQVEAARTLQLPVNDDPRCVRFIQALGYELAKTPGEFPVLSTSITDGRSATPLTVSHTATCDATDDRAVDFTVQVKQGSKVLADVTTEYWLND